MKVEIIYLDGTSETFSIENDKKIVTRNRNNMRNEDIYEIDTGFAVHHITVRSTRRVSILKNS